jgi:hypothetical protein
MPTELRWPTSTLRQESSTRTGCAGTYSPRNPCASTSSAISPRWTPTRCCPGCECSRPRLCRCLVSAWSTRQARPSLGSCRSAARLFDAFVEYRLPRGAVGFVGVETKYHEDLSKGLRIPAERSPVRAKYLRETDLRRAWQDGAGPALLAHRKNLQFWHNQLLAQRTFELVRVSSGARKYSEYNEVVVASRHDRSAHAVVDTVMGQLADAHQQTLHFCSIEDVLDLVSGHDSWKRELRERYTDFAPIQEHLPTHSPLKF